MGKYGLIDLEKHFAFYGAYHSNSINILIHMIFVWPIFFTACLILYFTPPLFSLPQVQLSLFGYGVVLFFNVGFFLGLIYALFYICLDPKAGSLAALLCAFCWVASSLVAGWLGFSLAWKEIRHLFGIWILAVNLTGEQSESIHFSYCAMPGAGIKRRIESVYSIDTNVVLVSQIVCWTGQFIGHGVFEKRAPALLDNLVQAFIMAPFFVLLEALQTSFGYEPYPGFHASVQAKIDADMKEWREKNLKLLS
ncbi:hypothetical protein NC653_020734 [Populus alba x Populus x berolinensis]|uniref:Endoplasmic reticulum membrane protein n=1 Tax=Populus alba x Populus x berolinensis TaxID=444605 RepID=A0AAD6ML55_9ROSI|nr:hypothetical protein NC653_020734 [Populus alba x Populus x berolinensis]